MNPNTTIGELLKQIEEEGKERIEKEKAELEKQKAKYEGRFFRAIYTPSKIFPLHKVFLCITEVCDNRSLNGGNTIKGVKISITISNEGVLEIREEPLNESAQISNFLCDDFSEITEEEYLGIKNKLLSFLYST